MAEANEQTAKEQPKAKAPAAPSDTVKVRLKTGSMVVSRIKDSKNGQIVSEEIVYGARIVKDALGNDKHVQGDVFDMSRDEAEKLLKRKFDGYPTNINPNTGSIQIAQWPNIVVDSPIELVGPSL